MNKLSKQLTLPRDYVDTFPWRPRNIMSVPKEMGTHIYLVAYLQKIESTPHVDLSKAQLANTTWPCAPGYVKICLPTEACSGAATLFYTPV
jgi:hypothetical protein